MALFIDANMAGVAQLVEQRIRNIRVASQTIDMIIVYDPVFFM